MKKLIYLLFLLPFYLLAQNPTSFPYGVKITGGQPTNSTPVYFTCTELNGLQTKIASALIEKTANKSNDLTVWDGTGAQYIGKDGFNAFATKFAQVATKTGLLSKADTFNLIPLTNSTLRISPVESAMFWDELFVMNTTASSAIKSFAQKDYVLTELVTATGGNVNTNPITTDGKHVRYLAYDKNGNVYSSATNFISNNTLLQLGFVTVLKTGATVEFIDGTAGPRNVLAQPALASNTAFDKVASTITNVSVGRKSNASFSTSNGTITGISVNWKSPANPTNSDPIDVFNYTGQTTAAFVAIDPTFLTSTSAITTHTLLTELDGGIPVNESFYNTTTGVRGTMANGSSAVARIMVGVRGGIFWQMGEFPSTACYADLATAKSNIYSHVFSDAIVPPGVAYEIARVAFTKGVTVTNNDTQFYLVNTGGGSGGSSTIPPVSDATTATKGIIKLAGDLSGTADLPVVSSVNGIASTDLMNLSNSSQTVSVLKTFNNNTLGLRNIANTFTSFIQNSNTASRTYTLPDVTGTLAVDANVLHTTGNESFTGTKSSTISGGNNAIFITNNGAGTCYGATNNSAGNAFFVTNNSTGRGLRIDNTSGGAGGTAMLIDNSTGATGKPFQYTKNSVERAFLNDAGTFSAQTLVAAAGTIRLFGYTVATLPAGTIGDTAYVTDATAPTFGTAVTGGGAVVIPVFYNGTTWIAH